MLLCTVFEGCSYSTENWMERIRIEVCLTLHTPYRLEWEHISRQWVTFIACLPRVHLRVHENENYSDRFFDKKKKLSIDEAKKYGKEMEMSKNLTSFRFVQQRTINVHDTNIWTCLLII